jgi:hypothetical protein
LSADGAPSGSALGSWAKRFCSRRCLLRFKSFQFSGANRVQQSQKRRWVRLGAGQDSSGASCQTKAELGGSNLQAPHLFLRLLSAYTPYTRRIHTVDNIVIYGVYPAIIRRDYCALLVGYSAQVPLPTEVANLSQKRSRTASKWRMAGQRLGGWPKHRNSIHRCKHLWLRVLLLILAPFGSDHPNR